MEAGRRANIVFITADVHYTAAHHYSPERAAYTDFDPFWEFVSGPLAAETFPRKDGLLDQTFGPEVVFSKGNDTAAPVAAGRNQFFGHLATDAAGALTVTLHEASGEALWTGRSSPPDRLRPPGRRVCRATHQQPPAISPSATVCTTRASRASAVAPGRRAAA